MILMCNRCKKRILGYAIRECRCGKRRVLPDLYCEPVKFAVQFPCFVPDHGMPAFYDMQDGKSGILTAETMELRF